MKRILFFMLFIVLIKTVTTIFCMESNDHTPPQQDSLQLSELSVLSTWARALNITSETIRTFFIEVLTFDQEQPHVKKYSFSGGNLTILAPPHVKVKKTDEHHLLINQRYYDATLRGKFIWKNGGLENKKGKQIYPLL